MTERKLATIRTVSELKPIEGADRIELAVVDGWQVIVQKGEYNPGDRAVYVEIDSWVPHAIAPFLTKGKTPKEYKGIPGNRLKTVRMKGVLSQGLLLPITTLIAPAEEGVDVSSELGVFKWEKEIPTALAGICKGSFPSFLVKTDQERIQNCWKYFDEGDKRDSWVITEKLDGSSMTVYLKDGEFGVCSRNIDLKEDETNSFWKTARKLDLENKLRKFVAEVGEDIAIQGELIGPGIQGNPYNLTEHMFYVFAVYNITNQMYEPVGTAIWFAEKSLQIPFAPLR